MSDQNIPDKHGFTWKMVDNLRQLQHQFERERRPQWEEAAQSCRVTADAIASYLPPREVST